MASVRGILNIQSLNELTYEKPSYTAQPLLAVDVEDVRVGVSAHKGPPAAM